MGKFDDTPLRARIAPAVVAGSLIVYSLTHRMAPLAIGAVGALALIGSNWKVAKFKIRNVFKNKEVNNKYNKIIKYTLEIEDLSNLPKLLSFIQERSRRASLYTVEIKFNNGLQTLNIFISGKNSIIEKEVFESTISTLLQGIRIKETNFINLNNKIEGKLYLGIRLDKPLPEPIYLEERDIEGHIGVFGGTGAGKSTTLQVIARRAKEMGYKVIIVDWTGEYKRLKEAGFKLLSPLRGDLPVDVLQCRFHNGSKIAVEALVRALDLTEPQTFMLMKIIDNNKKSIKSVLSGLEEVPEYSKWDREVKRALQRKLGLLVLGETGKAFTGCGISRLNEEDQGIIVDASSIPGIYERRAYALLFLAMMYVSHMEGFRTGAMQRRLILLDEVHNIYSNIVYSILAEARKYGLSLAYATQSPALIGDAALLNTSTKIVHALRSQKDKRVILDSMGLGEEWMIRLDKLARGTAILQSPSYAEPILIHVKL